MRPSILLVGTKRSGFAYLSMLLEKAGYRAKTCREPQTIDELLEHEQVDLIFVDDHGSELDAADLCVRLRKRPELAGVPVIMALSTDRDLHEELKRRNDVHPVVLKPILPHRFLATVEEALASAAQGDPPD